MSAIKGEKTLIDLAQEFDVHPNQIKQWRDQLLEAATDVFGEPAKAELEPSIDVKTLHADIGELKLENDFFVRGARQGGSVAERKKMIDPKSDFVGALTLRGFIAPWVLNGPINAEAFETYVEKVHVPELRKGDIVVMGNLSSDKGPRVLLLIEAAGAQLRYLPPYAPDLNPIENAFPKLRGVAAKSSRADHGGAMDQNRQPPRSLPSR